MDIEILRAEKNAAYSKIIGRAESAKKAVDDYKKRTASIDPDLNAKLVADLLAITESVASIDSELKTNMSVIGAFGIVSTGTMHGPLEDVADTTSNGITGKHLVDGIYDLSGHNGGTIDAYSNIDSPSTLNICFYSTVALSSPLTIMFYNNGIFIDTIVIPENFEIGLYVHTTEPKLLIDVYQAMPSWKNFNRLSIIDTATSITDISNLTNGLGIGTTTITQDNPRFDYPIKSMFSSLPHWQKGYDSTDVTSAQFNEGVYPIMSSAAVTMDINSGFTILSPAVTDSEFGISIFSDTPYTYDVSTQENDWDSGSSGLAYTVNVGDSTLLFTAHYKGSAISSGGTLEDRRIKLYDFNEVTGTLTLLDEKYSWIITNAWKLNLGSSHVFVTLETYVDSTQYRGRLRSYRLNEETKTLEFACDVYTNVSDADLHTTFTVDGIHYFMHKSSVSLLNVQTVYRVDPVNGILSERNIYGASGIEAIAVNRKEGVGNIAIFSAPSVGKDSIAIWRGLIVSDERGDITIISPTQLVAIPSGFRADNILYTTDRNNKKSCIFTGIKLLTASGSVASRSCMVEMEDMLSVPIVADNWTHYIDFIYNSRRFYHCLHFTGSSMKYKGIFSQNNDLSYTQKMPIDSYWSKMSFNVNGNQYYFEKRYDKKNRIHKLTGSDQYLDWLAIGR